jgi:hypothetical protein
VKKKIIAIPIMAALVVFIISYTAMEKSSANELSIKKEIKEKPIAAKSKTKKKKTSTKTKTNKFTSSKQASSEKTDDDEEPAPTPEAKPIASENSTIMNIVTNKIDIYAQQNNMSTEYCFLVDMSLPSGRNRFFIYDLIKRSIVYSGLVAHGSCNEQFLSRPKFSNNPKTGCSSLGKYKVGEFYTGKYGKSYRLHGLDDCNSNAFKRAVVIHGYDCVPDREIYPRVLCNSLGCVMVSYNFFDKVSRIIRKTDKPVVLWVYQ